MQNPFESGHIKNYILLYVSIVVIMVLFFIASTLFHEVGNVDKKVFDTNITQFAHMPKGSNKYSRGDNTQVRVMKNVIEVNGSRFKILTKHTSQHNYY